MRYKYNDLLFYWQGDSDENILLEEYHSDGDDEKDREAEEEEEEEGAGSMKIFYCSRTHSQAGTASLRWYSCWPVGTGVGRFLTFCKFLTCLS